MFHQIYRILICINAIHIHSDQNILFIANNELLCKIFITNAPCGWQIRSSTLAAKPMRLLIQLYLDRLGKNVQ